MTGYESKRAMAQDKLAQEPIDEFAIRADERKACEQAIEELMPDANRGDCAEAIRKRGVTVHCQCKACKNGNIHDSDCSVHNGDALPEGPCDCIYTAPPQCTVQVSPLEFVEMVMDKEHLVGNPIVWAQWPNKEKNT